MGIFGKKKGSEFEGLHNDNLFNDDDDILVPNGQRRSNAHSIGHSNAFAPHALTADELSYGRSSDTATAKPQADSVYKRLKEREHSEVDESFDDNYVPSWATATEKKEAIPATQDMPTFQSTANEKVNKADRIVEQKKKAEVIEPSHSPAADSFLERCRIAVEKATVGEISAEEPIKEKTNETIEEIKVETPAETKHESKTESVDEMIRMLRGSEHATADSSLPTAKCEDAATITEEVDISPTDSDSEIIQTVQSNDTNNDVRVYGKIVHGTVLQHTVDGDIEGSEFVKATKASQSTLVAGVGELADVVKITEGALADEKTIMFGSLGDIIAQRAEDDINTTINPDSDDDFDDEDDYYDRPYYETRVPELENIDDYKDLNDAARLRTKLMAEKSSHKTITLFSAVITFLMTLISTPLVGLLNLPAKTVMMAEVILLVAALVMNWDIFRDFKRFSKMRPSFDSCVAVCSTMVVIQTAVSAFMYDGKYSYFALATALMLTCNRIAHFMKSSRILKGIELIANSDEKRAVVSISGSNAKTLSSGAVEGEAMALCDRKAINIRDYMKNVSYDSPFDRKAKALFFIVSILSVFVGAAIGYFGGLGLGLSVATALMCCFWPACAAFICELPMYITSKKLARKGAMLAGYKGAYELNLANLVAVSSSDLFPSGSVKLYNMKTLNENEIGKTIVDAGAVAIAANSPLSNIFREIVGNENGFPKVNGVQYEDKMGISGWIGERTILIGNRNLMQGHNVAVPPASVDQKILRAGYFPVYIAIDGVPCLLFIVKYTTDPAISEELQKLCSTGMTVIVDPKDPNTSGAMICDYFGLPNDALKVMNHNGRVSYEHVTSSIESASAPASFKDNVCGFFSAVTASVKISSIYSVLTALFVISSVLAITLIVYLFLTARLSLLTSLTFAGFHLVFVCVSTVIAKVRSIK